MSFGGIESSYSPDSNQENNEATPDKLQLYDFMKNVSDATNVVKRLPKDVTNKFQQEAMQNPSPQLQSYIQSMQKKGYFTEGMSSSDPKLTVACFQSVLPGAAVTGIADPYFMKSVATYALEHNIAFVPGKPDIFLTNVIKSLNPTHQSKLGPDPIGPNPIGPDTKKTSNAETGYFTDPALDEEGINVDGSATNTGEITETAVEKLPTNLTQINLFPEPFGQQVPKPALTRGAFEKFLQDHDVNPLPDAFRNSDSCAAYVQSHFAGLLGYDQLQKSGLLTDGKLTDARDIVKNMQKSEYAQLSHSLMQYIDQSSPKNIDVSTQDAQKRLSDLVARLHTPGTYPVILPVHNPRTGQYPNILSKRKQDPETTLNSHAGLSLGPKSFDLMGVQGDLTKVLSTHFHCKEKELRKLGLLQNIKVGDKICTFDATKKSFVDANGDAVTIKKTDTILRQDIQITHYRDQKPCTESLVHAMITKGLTPLGVMIPDPNKIDLTPPDAELQKQSDEFFDGVVAVKGPTFKDMDSLKKHYQCVFEDAYTAKGYKDPAGFARRAIQYYTDLNILKPKTSVNASLPLPNWDKKPHQNELPSVFDTIDIFDTLVSVAFNAAKENQAALMSSYVAGNPHFSLNAKTQLLMQDIADHLGIVWDIGKPDGVIGPQSLSMIQRIFKDPRAQDFLQDIDKMKDTLEQGKSLQMTDVVVGMRNVYAGLFDKTPSMYLEQEDYKPGTFAESCNTIVSRAKRTQALTGFLERHDFASDTSGEFLEKFASESVLGDDLSIKQSFIDQYPTMIGELNRLLPSGAGQNDVLKALIVSTAICESGLSAGFGMFTKQGIEDYVGAHVGALGVLKNKILGNTSDEEAFFAAKREKITSTSPLQITAKTAYDLLVRYPHNKEMLAQFGLETQQKDEKGGVLQVADPKNKEAVLTKIYAALDNTQDVVFATRMAYASMMDHLRSQRYVEQNVASRTATV